MCDLNCDFLHGKFAGASLQHFIKVFLCFSYPSAKICPAGVSEPCHEVLTSEDHDDDDNDHDFLAVNHPNTDIFFIDDC